MKIDGNQIRPGNTILFDGKLWIVTKTQHTQPGKGGAYMQAELKGIKDGSKSNERFRSSEKVERVALEEIAYQFLYEDQGGYVLMNNDTFAQLTVSKDIFSGSLAYLAEQMTVTVSFYDGTPIIATLPSHVVLTVAETEPVVKGQTAASSYKAALLDNGERVMVPPHIEQGTKIVVDTRDGSYLERHKYG